MRWFFSSTLLIICLLSAGFSHAIERLSQNQMKGICAQSGISMAFGGVTYYREFDFLEIGAVDNRDPFGNLTLYDQESIIIDKYTTFAVVNSRVDIGLGVYQAPDEHLKITDLTQKGSTGETPYFHWYAPWRKEYTTSLLPKSEPVYWEIGDDIQRPLDNRTGVLQVTVADFTADMNVEFTLKTRNQNHTGQMGVFDLGHVALSGISMPELIHEGVNLPGSVLTLYSEGCGINMELRTRLSMDGFKIGNSQSGTPDLEISGIHLGEAFSFELPGEWRTSGSGTGNSAGGESRHWTGAMISGLICTAVIFSLGT